MAREQLLHQALGPSGVVDERHAVNRAAPGIPYFTPAQTPPAGASLDLANAPKLFQPLKIRGMTIQNRIMVSPMCQYSAEDGHHTMWHLTHLGGIVQRGPGLTCIEATSVTPNGRITPEDSGLWKDSQIEPLRKSVEFAHSQDQKIMIQLGHAGRKASTVAPWLSDGKSKDIVATAGQNGWPLDLQAPSAVAFSEFQPTPRAMTLQEIDEFKQAWTEAVKRSLIAGFDGIELHAAHGYLLHEFLTPAVNQRKDQYGGSFENRIRLLVETAELTRSLIPEDMPLFVRISATDWLEKSAPDMPQWRLEDSIELVKVLASKGVDAIDVSSGGAHNKQHIHAGPAYQAPFAKKIKEAVGDKLFIGAVGSITEGKQAEGLLQDGLDIIAVARPFQKNPGLVFAWADELETAVNMPNQIRWGFAGRGGFADKGGKKK